MSTIHGDVQAPSTLCLPTETSSEPYRTDEDNARLASLQVIHPAREARARNRRALATSVALA
jgi:hypothetical protein